MKLYMVIADTYTGEYGTILELLLVTTDWETAVAKVKEAEAKGWTARIERTETETETNITLGGYIE